MALFDDARWEQIAETRNIGAGVILRGLHRQVCVGLSFLAMLALSAAPSRADEASPSEPGAGLTQASVQDRLKRVEDSPDLDKDQKAKIVDLYKGTLEQLTNARDWEAKVAEYQSRRQTDPEALKELKAELNTAPSDPLQLIPDDATLPQLEQGLVDAETKLKALQAKRRSMRANQNAAVRNCQAC